MPRNAMVFCLVVSLAGPIPGREALGWFVDMSAIGTRNIDLEGSNMREYLAKKRQAE